VQDELALAAARKSSAGGIVREQFGEFGDFLVQGIVNATLSRDTGG
jgi:hypothetical protein